MNVRIGVTIAVLIVLTVFGVSIIIYRMFNKLTYLVFDKFLYEMVWITIERGFSIVHVRMIQREYKRRSLNMTGRSVNSDRLRFLLMKEWYYKQKFSPWGRYHPSCVSTLKHRKFMSWLFPDKQFQELNHVPRYDPDFNTWYQNEVYRLNSKKSVDYDQEAKTWRNRNRLKIGRMNSTAVYVDTH